MAEGALEVLETRTFPKSPLPAEGEEGTADTLFDWIEAMPSARVYMLLPAGMTISRVLELSDEEGEDLAFSLRLQAESHLLGGASAHRICMAPLPPRRGGPNQGLVITWPESSSIELPLLAEDPACISETAALLAMMPEEALESPLLHAERESGSLALVMESGDALTVRSTREQDADAGRWRESVVRAVVETALTAGRDTEEAGRIRSEVLESIEGREEILLMPDSVRTALADRVKGAGDKAWWQEWGMSVGALLATEGPLQTLTTLSPRRPVETGGVLGEITSSLAKPMTAAAILVAAFFVVALAPLVTAWLQLAIVQSKVDDQTQLEAVLKTTRQQEAVYNEIASRSWPMTKILGDVANCIPLGIEIDQITINEGDAIILRGSAGSYDGLTPKELLNEMTIRLATVAIFDAWDLSEDTIDSSGRIGFSITLPVIRPFRYIRNFSEDYGEKSHGERRYAEAYAKIAAYEAKQEADAAAETEADETVVADAEAREEPATTGSESAEPEPPARSDGRGSTRSTTRVADASGGDEPTTPPGIGREALTGVRGGGSRRSSDSSSSRSSSIRNSSGSAVRRSDSSGAVSSGGAAPVPEAFTDTELASLSKPEANQLLERIARAKLRDDLDDETKQRLRTDLYRVLDHMKSIPNPGGS